MSVAKKLALIALGYAVALAGGYAAVALNEAAMPADVSQGSSGMVAFGDMVLFVLVAGFLSLVPSWFLLRLAIARWPRTLPVLVLLVAIAGPLSWLSMFVTASPDSHYPEVLGTIIVFGAVPRIVLGPILVVAEGIALLVSRDGTTRRLLGFAMLCDLIPLGLFALHMMHAF